MTDSVFGPSYADAYDLLYQDKDYEHECDFLVGVFDALGADVRSILDLGCGTGGHAIPLSRRGFRVVGVDRSSEMLEIARKKAMAEGLEIDFHEGDLRNLRIDERFDAVISMFAVMSYQIENADLDAACETASHHLSDGGVFCFDAWHGPGVLTDPPTPRLRVIDDGGVRLLRYTSPELDVLSHTVETRFHLLRVNADQVENEYGETHVMRFLFPMEIARYLGCAGFQPPSFYSFPELGGEPGRETWQMAVAARLRG